MRLTAIANQTSRDSGLAKSCLNWAYLNCHPKLNWKSKTNKWYTSADFQEAKRLFDNVWHQMEEVIDYEAMGLKWFRGFVMPISYYPGMDDCDHTNQLHIISPSVPPDNQGTPPSNHVIPIPPPSPDKSKMLPPPTPPHNKKERDGSNIGGLLMDLAKDGFEDGTSTPAEEEACTVPPAPANKETGMTPPAAAKDVAGTIPPAPTEKDSVRFHKHPPRTRPVRLHQLPTRKRLEQPCQHPPGKMPVQPQKSLPILSRRAPYSPTGLPLPAAKVTVSTTTSLRMKNT